MKRATALIKSPAQDAGVGFYFCQRGPTTPVIKRGAQAAEQAATETTSAGKLQLSGRKSI